MSFPRETYAARRRKVLDAAMAKGDFDALCVTEANHVRYLTGLTEGCRHLMLSPDGDLLLTTVMFHERVSRECLDMQQAPIAAPLMKAIGHALDARGWKRIALIDSITTVADWNQWRETRGRNNITAIPDVVADCRSIKDAAECDVIRRAVAVAEKAFLEFMARGRRAFIGKSERELALELEVLLRQGGADDQAFEKGIILASGTNSHKAHYLPGDRKIRDGDNLLIDWGAEVDGYRSDLTRVVAIGGVSEELQAMHAAVKAAHLAAAACMKPGMAANAVDAVARNVIARAGYPVNAFRHGLGHGLGLDVHEAPRLAEGWSTVLQAGMVLTVEPGVYFPEIGGVRLERDVVVTEKGSEPMGALGLDWFVV